MISSLEEALLLLKKWKSESSRVIALTGHPSLALRFDGTVDDVSDEGVFKLLAGGSFMLVDISGCTVSYEQSLQLNAMLKEGIPLNWDSSIHLGFPDQSGLSMFSVPTR